MRKVHLFYHAQRGAGSVHCYPTIGRFLTQSFFSIDLYAVSRTAKCNGIPYFMGKKNLLPGVQTPEVKLSIYVFEYQILFMQNDKKVFVKQLISIIRFSWAKRGCKLVSLRDYLLLLSSMHIISHCHRNDGLSCANLKILLMYICLYTKAEFQLNF